MPSINPISQSNYFEFNDSVLDTKAWNSSRYDGRQLKGSKINEYNRRDTTWAHTPVISNYSRNIYIGSRVIGMREPGLGNHDDPTLTPFPGFSYITVDEYITVNSDNSITKRSVRGGKGINDDLNSKKGFYNAWYQDFPIGTKAEIKPIDKKLAQSLSPRYSIFNNSGQLQKLVLVTAKQPSTQTNANNETTLLEDSGSFYASSYNTSSLIFEFCTGSGNPNGLGDIQAEYSIFNSLLLMSKFFTGSLIATPSEGGVTTLPADNSTSNGVVGDDDESDVDDGGGGSINFGGD